MPSARSQGGFRLYTEPDVDRLELIKRMKPLGFQLKEMRDLLAVLDPQPGAPRIHDPVARLTEFSATAEEACEQLSATLRIAEEFAAMLRASPTSPDTRESGQAVR